jgi:SAM-dependent methyltransferase
MFGASFGTSLASLYDYIYCWKDYHKEALWIQENLRELGCVDGKLLEMACGTGKHIEHFAAFQRFGIDLCEESMMLASFRAPEARFEKHDMAILNKESGFCAECELILALFGATGYLESSLLEPTFRRWSELLKLGGFLALEPWYDEVKEGCFLQSYETKSFKICRMADVQEQSGKTVMSFEFLISRAGARVERLHSQEILYNHSFEQLLALLELSGFQLLRKTEGAFAADGLWILQKVSTSSA